MGGERGEVKRREGQSRERRVNVLLDGLPRRCIHFLSVLGHGCQQ